MSLTTQRPARPVVYPDSDGLPMAENTLQFEWIVLLEEGLADLFRDDPNVFVAGDLLGIRSRVTRMCAWPPIR